MTVDSCFLLGRIIKPHGIKGEMLIHLDVEEPQQYLNLESVFVEIQQKLVPFFIDKLSRPENKKAILKFEDIDKIEDTEALLSKNLYVSLDKLPSLKDDQFYYHQITGFQVEDKTLGLLGTIKEIYEMPGQDLINMDFRGVEVLIPINNDIVLKANHFEKKLYVNLPAGLVDMYLDAAGEPDDED